MNEFIQQFVLESREQVEQATSDLLALEKSPDDRAPLDSAFRSFHTLKGGAGIVEFKAMADAVHVAEEALSGVRSGARTITAQLIGNCLACLDQVVQWLDTMERTGEIPTHAQAEARALVARLGQPSTDQRGAQREPDFTSGEWSDVLLGKHPTIRQVAQTAIRYRPGPDAFFEGKDPIARIAELPGLLAIDAEPASPWPPIDALDPHLCNLVITALTRSSRTDVVSAIGDEIDCCDIQDIAGRADWNEGPQLSLRAREVLEAQIAIIGGGSSQGAAGRMASAGAVAANVLRNAGRIADAELLARHAANALAQNDPRFLREAIEHVLSGTSSTAVASPSAATDHAAAARTLRVDASRIDALVNLTGELVVAKNSLGHVAKLAEQGIAPAPAVLKRQHAALDRLIAELQRSVLGMRVLPLRQVFQRFPRLLREMSADLGKPVTLLIGGGDTEADKAIVEMLFEPLLHVFRNAIDHGIEKASTRAERGKQPVATIRLRAQRQGEHVVVEVSDDGGGIDVARVRQVARQRRIVAEDIIDSMTEQAVIDMIFEPGFSTAAKVTGVSGRGVGMDAVRTAVRQIGGQVTVESRAGEGTTVRFTLPFSVMMTRVMVVTAGEHAFGIAIDAVIESLRVNASRIVPIGAAHAIVLRNRTLPVVSLADALGLPRQESEASEATIVVTKIDGQYSALRVDSIGERMEVMIKPLDGLLAGTRGVVGSTLVGDGSVLLILDLGELLQ